MKERQRNRNRFFNAKNITIGSGLLTFLAGIIHNDLKKENSFLKNIFRKITGSNKKPDSSNILDITDSAKIIESDKKK